MILFNKSQIGLSTEHPLLPGITISAEGLALVGGWSGGVFGVRPSTGAAGEIFTGIALSRPLPPASLPLVETLTIPPTETATTTISMASVPVAGTLRVVKDSTGTAYTVQAGAPSAATQVQNAAASKDLVFQASEAGSVITVTYVRNLTVLQAQMITGYTDIGGAAGAYMGQVGMMKNGTVYTSAFDTTVDWKTNPVDLRLGANGVFTIGGPGAVVPGYVIEAPTTFSGGAFLGLHISAV